MAKKKKIEGFTQPMTSMDYFFSSEADSQPFIKAAPRTAAVETPIRHNESITLIYIKSGRGRISINAGVHELHRGVLMAISDYQPYKITPEGGVLHYVECQFPYLLFLYFMANPYFRFRSPGFGAQPVYADLDEKNAETVERLMGYILVSHSKGRHGDREILQIMEVFGFLIKFSGVEAAIDRSGAPASPLPEPD